MRLDDILKKLLDWCDKTQNDDPFIRHVKYECIHPFSDGNGRSGRIILASDLNFDLKNLNDMIGNDYINSQFKNYVFTCSYRSVSSTRGGHNISC